MNGRMAKQLRKVAANPQVPEDTGYKAIQHPKVMYQPRLQEDGTYAYEQVGIVRLQIVLDNCQRKLYKVWKNRYRAFIQRSDTLPNRGLQVKCGG